MYIALVHEALTYWLAGEPAVSQRVHSGAADLVISGDIALDQQGRVRASSMRYSDRKNLSATVSFTTTRVFDTEDEAEDFSATYDAVYPRTGYLDLYNAAGEARARLLSAVVKPPTRRLVGLSLILEYTVVGGAWLIADGEGGFETPEITMGGEVVTMGTIA
jgi:hypothetical protein